LFSRDESRASGSTIIVNRLSQLEKAILELEEMGILTRSEETLIVLKFISVVFLFWQSG
jgi:hypothetical protein